MKEYKAKGFCPNCNEETPMVFVSQEHERDSSYDHITCQKCEESYFSEELSEIEWDFVEETFIEKIKGMFL